MADVRVAPEELQKSRLLLQARSLCNVLGVLQRRLDSLKSTGSYTAQDIEHYRAILEDVDARWRQDGVFAAAVSNVDPEVQTKCSILFNYCCDTLQQLAATAPDMEPAIKFIYQRLLSLNQDLRAMTTRTHTYSEVRTLQEQLDEVDRSKTDGVFGGSPSTHVPHGQAVCAELLSTCYELVEELLGAAEDMIPEMRTVCSNLMGIRGALWRLKEKKEHTNEDLRYYQNQLDAMDNKRVDGIFCGSLSIGTIPEGQACASDLLAECYELVGQLQETAGELSPEVSEIYHQLHGVYHSLEKMDGSIHYTLDVKRLQGMLDAIDSKRVDGVFGGDLTHVPAGQALCSSLLHRAYRMVEKLYASAVDGEEFYNVPHMVKIPPPSYHFAVHAGM